MSNWDAYERGLERGPSGLHKTTRETGDGSELMCAGAIEWMTRRGISTNLLRVMERLDSMFVPRVGTPGEKEKG